MIQPVRSIRFAARKMPSVAIPLLAAFTTGGWNGALLSRPQAADLPSGSTVIEGNAVIAATGNTLNINAGSDRTIINWDSFNIGSGHTAQFDLPNNGSAILNRVTTPGSISHIDGVLNSNGTVYLVNPNGIVVSNSGTINTQGFLATTLDVNNQQFMNGQINLDASGSSGTISNEGTITTASGGAHLIAGSIFNGGTIESNGGSINLIAGGSVKLDNGLVLHQASLDTVVNGISPAAGVIHNSGTIRATGAVEVDGGVYLVNPGGRILHDGTIKTNHSNTQITAAAIHAPGKIEIEGSGNTQIKALSNQSDALVMSGSVTKTGPVASELSISAHGGVQITGKIDATGSGGLNTVIEAGVGATSQGTLTIGQDIHTGGGNLDVISDSAITFNGNLYSDGGNILFRAGDLSTTTSNNATVSLNGDKVISSGTGDVALMVERSPTGGRIIVDSTGHLTLTPSGIRWEGIGEQLDFVGSLHNGDLIVTHDMNWLTVRDFGNLTGFTLGKTDSSNSLLIHSPIAVAGPITLIGRTVSFMSNTTLDTRRSLPGEGNIRIESRGGLGIRAPIYANGNIDLISGSVMTLDAPITSFGEHRINLDSGFHIYTYSDAHIVGHELLVKASGDALFSNANDVNLLAVAKTHDFRFTDINGLTIGSIDDAHGIPASGKVAVSSWYGDIVVQRDILSGSPTGVAVMINAGRDAAAGDARGGNIVLNDNVKIRGALRSQVHLYSGSINDSSGLPQLAGLGSGRFRYNSDEVTSNFTRALQTGVNVIYREQPVITVGINNQTMTYGGTVPNLTYNVNGLRNGDSIAQLFPNRGVDLQGSYDADGHLVVGTHPLAGIGFTTTDVGYQIAAVRPGTLAVNSIAPFHPEPHIRDQVDPWDEGSNNAILRPSVVRNRLPANWYADHRHKLTFDDTNPNYFWNEGPEIYLDATGNPPPEYAFQGLGPGIQVSPK